MQDVIGVFGVVSFILVLFVPLYDRSVHLFNSSAYSGVYLISFYPGLKPGVTDMSPPRGEMILFCINIYCCFFFPFLSIPLHEIFVQLI
jgi:hypothetical protein